MEAGKETALNTVVILVVSKGPDPSLKPEPTEPPVETPTEPEPTEPPPETPTEPEPTEPPTETPTQPEPTQPDVTDPPVDTEGGDGAEES